MPSTPYPGPLPTSPRSVPPQLRNSWQLSTSSLNTISSHESRFHEHLPPPTPPSQSGRWDPVSRVGSMFIPSMIIYPGPPPPLPPRSPSRPSRPARTESQDDVIPPSATYVDAPSKFSPDTPTAPTFPASAFRFPKMPIKDRTVDNVDVERGMPQRTASTKTTFSHRLSRKIEAMRQFVNLPYPFHAGLPAPLPPKIPPIPQPHSQLETGEADVSPISPANRTDSDSLRPLLLAQQARAPSPNYGYPRRMSVSLPVSVEIEHYEKRERSMFDRHGRPLGADKAKDDKKKKKRRLCIIIILVIIIIILATLGGVFGSRAAKSSSTVTTSSNSTVPTEVPIVTYTVQPTVAPVTLPGTTYLTTATATVTFTTTPTPKPSSTSATPTATPLSPALQNCLTQFQISAPSNPLGYPCGTCASLVATLPNDLAPGFVGSPTDPNTGGVSAGKLLQFCSLQTVFLASANSTSGSKNPFTSLNWMNNCDPCSGWSGVTCDSTGRVTQLQMTFPAVPQALSEASMSGMVGMQSLQITGNGQLPAGGLPQSLLQLTSLVTLHLQTTGLTQLSDNAFDALKALQQLTLAGNSNLGKTLPSSVSQLPLTSLVVNGQDLQTDLTSLLTSSASFLTTLQTLDLSGNSLSSSIPASLSAFTALVDLNLSSNDLTSLPAALPSSLKVLDMHQNAALKGALPSQVCTMGLQACNFKGTNVSASSCGVCQFGAS
ncbi:hypothetical protein CALCODRAFT_491530 [Calocera cornea HHB12733]|uniref:L domain-like protein n=1 Tax=Calocera cornea HHB12733 TaxID=1353952 RepID=A0A165IYM6_9BASI|nr:hypothetical protein CALCODRAFT_491530 [Calocera cornea HHB12733]